MSLKLKKSNSIIAGVCSGLAEHFGIDPAIIRIAFICSFVFLGIGIIPYLILWLVMALNK